MKRFLTAAVAAMMLAPAAQAEVTLNIYDHVSFYDGYLVANIPEDAPDQGCTRLYTYLCTKPLTDEQLSAIGENLRIDVNVHAVCDNYDRIGSVNLALVPKGAEGYAVNYNADDPLRIEVARFITPFMNKNKEPQTVPYTFDVPYLSHILRDASLRQQYDFWLEFMIFGVPYAANTQVAGCAGCNEVFQGSLDLVTDDEPAPLTSDDVFVPVTIRTADWRADRGMNNYNEACTDEIGKTVKTWTFTVPEDCADAQVVFIISNHGAGNRGEEYSRRDHFVYFDDALVRQFKPGRTSCEPFRVYNTQANGIYGSRPKTDAAWQSFSNWCPGDVIDTRIVRLGALEAGTHSFKIDVPDAVFYGADGYFPVSVYFQGLKEGRLPDVSAVEEVTADYTTDAYVQGDVLHATAPEAIKSLTLCTLSGLPLARITPGTAEAEMSVRGLDKGVYVVAIETASRREARKIAF